MGQNKIAHHHDIIYRAYQLLNLVLPSNRRHTYRYWQICQAETLIRRWHKHPKQFLLDKQRLGIIIDKNNNIIEGKIMSVTTSGIEFQHNLTGYNPSYTILKPEDYLALQPNPHKLHNPAH